MATNVEVTRSTNESNISIIRRFRKRVQGSGVLPRVRSIKYQSRPKSKFSKKRSALKMIEKRKEIERLTKLGKPLPRRGRKR